MHGPFLGGRSSLTTKLSPSSRDPVRSSLSLSFSVHPHPRSHIDASPSLHLTTINLFISFIVFRLQSESQSLHTTLLLPPLRYDFTCTRSIFNTYLSLVPARYSDAFQPHLHTPQHTHTHTHTPTFDTIDLIAHLPRTHSANLPLFQSLHPYRSTARRI